MNQWISEKGRPSILRKDQQNNKLAFENIGIRDRWIALSGAFWITLDPKSHQSSFRSISFSISFFCYFRIPFLFSFVRWIFIDIARIRSNQTAGWEPEDYAQSQSILSMLLYWLRIWRWISCKQPEYCILVFLCSQRSHTFHQHPTGCRWPSWLSSLVNAMAAAVWCLVGWSVGRTTS